MDGAPEQRAPADPGTEDRRLLDAAHRNLVAYMRLLATTAGGQVEEGEGYLLFAGAHEYPGTYTNGVIRTAEPGIRTVTPAELLARADAFFGRWHRPYVVWVRTHADEDLDADLSRRGLEVRAPAEGSPAALGRAGTIILASSEGLSIAETRDEDDYRTYLGLVASVYGLPDADLDLAEEVLFSRASLRHPDSHVYLARLAETGQVCGGTTTFIVGGAAHSAWSVADPSIRGRGVGSALVTFSALEAFELGAEFIWGVSSQMGAPIWNRLGFHTVTRYKRYLAAPAIEAPPQAPSARGSIRRRARPGA